jgi:hypothetical protein
MIALSEESRQLASNKLEWVAQANLQLAGRREEV